MTSKGSDLTDMGLNSVLCTVESLFLLYLSFISWFIFLEIMNR